LSAEPRIGRRAALAGIASLASFAVGPIRVQNAHARGRTALGGRVSLRVPWPLGSIDPHRLDDPGAALFGEALFDGLYARDDTGGFVPALAEDEPELEDKGVRVTLRAGLKTGRGRALDVGDVVASIARARANGARAWLADIPTPKIEGRSLLFANRDAARVVRALASPLVAIVKADFTPEAAEGTGPLRLASKGDPIVLSRNPNAARGPAFLEDVAVRSSPNLEASLRAFESGQDDLGWLGSGLHEPRPGSRTFDYGSIAWAVLFAGRDAAPWDAPGAAQKVCDGVPPSRLSGLGLGPPWRTDADDGWGGPPVTLLVRDDAAWLGELAKTLAATISRPSHEVVVKPVPPGELAQRRAARNFGLALDVVRPVAPGTVGAMASLATADDPQKAIELLRKPPKTDIPIRTIARGLRLGVVGEVRALGGRMPDVVLAQGPSGGIDWGATSRGRR